MKKVNFFAVLAMSTTFFLASCGSTSTEPAAEEAPVVEEAAPVEEVVEEVVEVADSTATETVAE